MGEPRAPVVAVTERAPDQQQDDRSEHGADDPGELDGPVVDVMAEQQVPEEAADEDGRHGRERELETRLEQRIRIPGEQDGRADEEEVPTVLRPGREPCERGETSCHAGTHDAVNLAQGFPDFPCPPELKEAAKAAIDADVNQYAITWGARELRHAIAAKVERTYPGWTVDPERELCITCGSTEAMIATMLALVDPGEEVVVFEPALIHHALNTGLDLDNEVE